MYICFVDYLIPSINMVINQSMSPGDCLCNLRTLRNQDVCTSDNCPEPIYLSSCITPYHTVDHIGILLNGTGIIAFN
jgi:hypothetical protein